MLAKKGSHLLFRPLGMTIGGTHHVVVLLLNYRSYWSPASSVLTLHLFTSNSQYLLCNQEVCDYSAFAPSCPSCSFIRRVFYHLLHFLHVVFGVNRLTLMVQMVWNRRNKRCMRFYTVQIFVQKLSFILYIS